MLTDIVVQCNNFDKLIEYEDYYMIDLYVKSSNLQYKTSWEQTRFISYITAQVNSSKKLNPTDLIRFAWDGKDNRRNTKAVSQEEKNKLLEKMKETELNLNNLT